MLDNGLAAVAIGTICVQGFPDDATPRELKNICRYIPGYQGAHVGMAGVRASHLFVRFETPEQAHGAILILTGEPFDQDAPEMGVMRAEFARREMEFRESTRPTPAWQGERPGLRIGAQRSELVQEAVGGELDTLAILNYKDKSLELEDLHAWFSQRRGFIIMHANERIPAVFAKFDSHKLADATLQVANEAGFGAEWARRNLTLDDPRGGAAKRHAPEAPMGGGKGARPRYEAGGGEGGLDTIAILGYKDKKLDAEYLHDWFGRRRGFVALHANERIPAVFVKFDSNLSADASLKAANEAGFGAEWARRNLDL